MFLARSANSKLMTTVTLFYSVQVSQLMQFPQIRIYDNISLLGSFYNPWKQLKTKYLMILSEDIKVISNVKWINSEFNIYPAEFNSFMTKVPIIEKLIHWVDLQIKGLVCIWWWPHRWWCHRFNCRENNTIKELP